MNGLEIAKNSGLHDYEIKDIIINYSDSNIKLFMKSPKGEICCFDINGFLLFNISHNEIWGEGIYVCSSEFLFDESRKAYLLENVLNSGDQITAHFL